MARIATTIEESKRLLELGIDPKSADMRWYREQKWFPYELQPYPYNESIITNKIDNEFILPAWSLDGLLKLLPNDIAVSFQKGNDEGTLYWVDTFLATTFSDTYIGAMVEMIELLVEEGYIKTKEE